MAWNGLKEIKLTRLYAYLTGKVNVRNKLHVQGYWLNITHFVSKPKAKAQYRLQQSMVELFSNKGADEECSFTRKKFHQVI